MGSCGFQFLHFTFMNSTAKGMLCVCILLQGGVSCLVSVYYYRVRCHVLHLYTVTG